MIAAVLAATIQLSVDAREASRRIIHARETIPAVAGPLTLVYPKWIPGTHSPGGPIADVAGITFSAGGKPIAWRRDDVDLFAFHLTVPAGATAVDATLDSLAPEDDAYTANVGLLNWNTVLLYPQGASADALMVSAEVTPPAEWSVATALPLPAGTGWPAAGAVARFAPASLATVVDSPLIMGRYLRRIPLAPEVTPAHELDVAGDSAASVEVAPPIVDGLSRLVRESGALFGARHYRSYHFLLCLSDHVDWNGTEHHESNDSRLPEDSATSEARWRSVAALLPHEFVHSWNGKYRRPAGLATTDYQQPMKGDLLWIYEGLTNHLGRVLTARAGFWDQDTTRDVLASVAAGMESRRGREWRPLEDTAVSASILYSATNTWGSWRRFVDFYNEGNLIWLEADAILRQRTKGARSLDDFCRAFFGGADSGPRMVPYTLEDVVTALNAIAPYDWGTFFHDRVSVTTAHAPLGGLEKAGWRLAYGPTPGPWSGPSDAQAGNLDIPQKRVVNLLYSLGFSAKPDGTIVDVMPGSPADRAGLAPTLRILGIGGRVFTHDHAHDALREGHGDSVEVVAQNGEELRAYRLEYAGRDRWPHLERIEGAGDLLASVYAPKVD